MEIKTFLTVKLYFIFLILSSFRFKRNINYTFLCKLF